MALELARRGRRAKVTSLALLGLLAAGCYTRQVRTNPSTALSDPVSLAQVTRTNGAVVAVKRPGVRADSLVGWSPSDDSLRIAIPLVEVRSVELKEFNPVRTILLFGVIAAAAAGAVFLIAMSSLSADY